MSDKKTTLVIFGYSDGSYEYAAGEQAQDVSAWLDACQTMQFVHGGQYRGESMILVPPLYGMEPIKPIAERTFPEWVAEISRTQQDK